MMVPPDVSQDDGSLTILLSAGFFWSVWFSSAASYTLNPILPSESTCMIDAELPHR
jgi:hypothetical protein